MRYNVLISEPAEMLGDGFGFPWTDPGYVFALLSSLFHLIAPGLLLYLSFSNNSAARL